MLGKYICIKDYIDSDGNVFIKEGVVYELYYDTTYAHIDEECVYSLYDRSINVLKFGISKNILETYLSDIIELRKNKLKHLLNIQ